MAPDTSAEGFYTNRGRIAEGSVEGLTQAISRGRIGIRCWPHTAPYGPIWCHMALSGGFRGLISRGRIAEGSAEGSRKRPKHGPPVAHPAEPGPCPQPLLLPPPPPVSRGRIAEGAVEGKNRKCLGHHRLGRILWLRGRIAEAPAEGFHGALNSRHPL